MEHVLDYIRDTLGDNFTANHNASLHDTGLILFYEGDACVLVRYDYYEHLVDDYTIDPNCTDTRRPVSGLSLEEMATVLVQRLQAPQPKKPALYETFQGEFYAARTRLEAAKTFAIVHRSSLCEGVAALRVRHDSYRPFRYETYNPSTRRSAIRADYLSDYKARGPHLVGSYRLVLDVRQKDPEPK